MTSLEGDRITVASVKPPGLIASMTSGGERVGISALPIARPAMTRPRLTARQWEVLQTLYDRDGYWSETCRDLGITKNTLWNFLKDIAERLGLGSSRPLVIFKAIGWAKR